MKKILLVLFPILIIIAGCKDNRTVDDLFKDIDKSIKNGELVSAKNDIEVLIIKAPESTDAFMLKGIIDTKLKQYDIAMLSFQKSIAFDTLNFRAYVERAKLKIALGDYNSAIKDCNIARLMKKKYYPLYQTKGMAFELLDDEANAVIQYECAIKYGDNSGETYYKLGLLFLDQGEKEKACTHLSKAGELGYMDAFEVIRSTCNKTQNESTSNDKGAKPVGQFQTIQKKDDNTFEYERWAKTKLNYSDISWRFLNEYDESGEFTLNGKEKKFIISDSKSGKRAYNITMLKKEDSGYLAFANTNNVILFSVDYDRIAIGYLENDLFDMYIFKDEDRNNIKKELLKMM